MTESRGGLVQKRMRWLVISAGILRLSVLTAPGATYYVATNGSDIAAGTSWDTAVLTISNAVAKTTAGTDVILVSNGIYKITNAIPFGAYSPIGLTIRGVYGASNTIIDAQGINRCFYMNRGTLDGFTLTNGFENSISSHQSGGAVAIAGYDGVRILNCIVVNCVATHYGGGIGVRDWGSTGADVIISNCVFRNNTAQYAGAVDLYCDRAHVYDCVFEGNKATSSADTGGGAIRVYATTNTIAGCTFRNNTAGNRGGAVRFTLGKRATSIISNCTFEGNSGLVFGGGLHLNAEATVVGCTFVSNAIGAGYGGGLYAGGSNALVSNCRFIGNLAHREGGGVYSYGTVAGSLFAGNVASNRGGGLYQNHALAVVRNCTIVSNRAVTDAGGGIYTVTGGVENSIVYFNTAAVSGSNWVCASGYFTNTCTAPSAAAYGTGNLEDNPLFADAAAGDYRLQSRSPCINAGLNQDWMAGAIDLDGNRRIRQLIVDMGAFEGLRDGTVFSVR